MYVALKQAIYLNIPLNGPSNAPKKVHALFFVVQFTTMHCGMLQRRFIGKVSWDAITMNDPALHQRM